MKLANQTAFVFLVAMTGCAGQVNVTRTYTPQMAMEAQNDTNLHPVAILRGGARIPLPTDAHIEARRVVLPRAQLYVHKLAPGDVIEQDARGRITAVRSASIPPTVTHFVPGTAESPSSSEDVRGVRADGVSEFVFQPNDAIEMHGAFSPDDALPGGGRVESSRSTGMLVAGIVVLSLSYAPTAYVGFGSSRSGDRVLALPAAGPWIDLVSRPACVAQPTPIALPVDSCIGETVSRAALVISGAVQDIGLILTLLGLPAHARVATDGSPAVSEAKPPPHIAIVPTLGGAAAFGTF